MEFGNIFYMLKLSQIGGAESFIYYIARYLKDYDITIMYKIGDANQVNRLSKYVRVVKWDNRFEKERIKCKKIFYNYFTEIAEFVDAEEHIQVLHTDYKEQLKNIGYGFIPNPIIQRYIAPTEVVARHFTEMYGFPCEVVANPIVLDKPRKVLHLISATRLTDEKGKNRMIKLGELLDKSKIPYLWTIFTNDKREIQNDHICYLKPQLDIAPYIADADYLVQLSDNGEGFGYTVAEALSLGTPVIVTPVEAFLEIGVKNGDNAFVIDWNVQNVNIDDIYKKRLKINYEPPMTRWKEIIAPGKSTYKPDNKLAVNIRSGYWDTELGVRVEPTKISGDCVVTTKERAKYLIENGVAYE